MTNTWTIMNWWAVIWLSLIATQVDISIVIFILCFFSFAHWVLVYQYYKSREGLMFDYIDFLSFIIVAFAAWIMFALMWLMAWIWEYYIYLSTAIWSISWKRGFETIFRWITKKITGKEIYLFEKD